MLSGSLLSWGAESRRTERIWIFSLFGYHALGNR